MVCLFEKAKSQSVIAPEVHLHQVVVCFVVLIASVLCHRWGIWVDCSEWWLDYMDHLRLFMEQSTPNDQHEVLLASLKAKVSEKKATMAFAVAHTEELVQLINWTQNTSEPVGVHFFVQCFFTLSSPVVQLALQISVCHNTIKQQSQEKLLKPRVQTALSAIGNDHARNALQAKFHQALQKVFSHTLPFLKKCLFS